jgi:hypothetical protein
LIERYSLRELSKVEAQEVGEQNRLVPGM